jgi:hypothetical protein
MIVAGGLQPKRLAGEDDVDCEQHYPRQQCLPPPVLLFPNTIGRALAREFNSSGKFIAYSKGNDSTQSPIPQ